MELDIISISSGHDSRRFVLLAFVCEGGLALIALAVGWLLKRPPLSQIEWSSTGLEWGLIASAPLLIGLVLTTRWPVGPLKRIEQVVDELLIPLFRDCSVGELLLISLLAGLGEELLFRGVVQEGIQELSGSPLAALAIASILFGLAHPITTAYAVLAALVGAYLGWLWLATDNLLVPVVTHAAYDFAALVYLLRGDRQS